MRKINYFWNIAPKFSKILHLVGIVIAAAILLITIFGANKAINKSFFELPFFQFFDEDGEMDTLKNEHEELLEDFDDLKRSEIREFEGKTGIAFDKFLEYFSNPSLFNLVKISGYVNQYDGETIDSETLTILKIIVLVVAGYATILGLFILLFGFFGSVGLAIFTLILSIPFHLVSMGTGFTIVLAILFVVYAVIQGKLNREYKRYKKAMKRAY